MVERRPPGNAGERGKLILFLLLLLLLVAAAALWGWLENPPSAPDPAATAFPETVPEGEAPATR